MKSNQRFWGAVVLGLVLMIAASGTARAELSVSEGVIATGVESLTPEGAAESFPASVGKLYAFTHVNGAEGETTIKHLWFHGDNLMAEVELPVRSPSWRTYSSKTILPDWTGPWRVDVTAEDGTVIQSLSFTLE